MKASFFRSIFVILTSLAISTSAFASDIVIDESTMDKTAQMEVHLNTDFPETRTVVGKNLMSASCSNLVGWVRS